MNDQSPLIVPLVVEALVVNDEFRNSTNQFMRTEMIYRVLERCANAQPLVTNNRNDTNFKLSPTAPVPPNQIPAGNYYNGVYLKWRLPAAFTHGLQDNASGTMNYRLVPNRWLIIRYSGELDSRQATAWIVESDYLYPNNVTPPAMNASQVACQFVQKGSDGLTPIEASMGRAVQLGTWSESGHDLKLTAIAPGNPAFAFYQPQCNNVFSFIDCLNGQPPQTLSYAVAGWFSDPDEDPLHKVKDFPFDSVIDDLDWKLPDGTDKTLTANWSLLFGSVDGVEWQNSSLPLGGAPKEPISVAVGNSSIEALTAMITAQAAQQGVSVDTDLLAAFQLDLIDIFDQPDWKHILPEKLQATFFQKFSGGYTWNIVDAPDANTQITPQELENELQWLAVLNQDQAALDEALRQLAAFQTSLYQMWWKYTDFPFATQGPSPIPGLDTPTALQQQLDPTVSGSLAQQTAQQMVRVQEKLNQVPHGDTPDELADAIRNYATLHNLPETRQLKRESAPLYYLPNNPVVLISGAKASNIVETSDDALCRFPSQLVTGFNFDGQTISASTNGLAAKIPQPDLSGVTGAPWSIALLNSLVQEFFFLDPNNARIVSAVIPNSTEKAVNDAMSDPANDVGSYPTGAVQQWQENPWHPLLVMWQVTYYPISYGTTQSPNWTFSNGQYSWNGLEASIGKSINPQGLIQLSPAAALNMRARIEAFLQNNPNLAPKEIEEFNTLLDFVKAADHWDLVSQALDGFNNQLQLGLPGVFLGPESTKLITNPSLPLLIGNAAEYPPRVGNIPSLDRPVLLSEFQPWRAGQFEFFNLVVIDEWGQALWPIDSHNNKFETIYTPPDLTPAHKVLPSSPDSFIQLPPALVQPAQLAFDLISATNDAIKFGPTNPGADPICGWVLPNHLDQSLMAYDSSGLALGEMAVGIAATDQPAICWEPTPGSPYTSLQQLAQAIPHFGPFLLSLSQQPPDTFKAFLRAIDETLWTTLPVGATFDQSLAVLIGRPLAMVRAHLQFLLDGPPDNDPSWQFTFTHATPEITSYEFGIELGNVDQFDDGLIGYFIADQYGTFNVVTSSGAAEGTYLKPIGVDNNFIYLPFDQTTSTYVSMLVDPRAPVHAITGILPVKKASLPLGFTTDALNTMKVTFRVDGILTDQQIPSNAGVLPAVLMPVPQEKTGQWSWLENDEGTWNTYPTAPNDTTARLSNVPPVLRRGLLQLSSALAPPQRPSMPLSLRRMK